VSYATISEVGSPPPIQSQGTFVAINPATPRQRTHQSDMSSNATENLMGSMDALVAQIIEFTEEIREAKNALARDDAPAADPHPACLKLIPGHMKSELVYYCESVLQKKLTSWPPSSDPKAKKCIIHWI
jgi:hypothetical protein